MVKNCQKEVLPVRGFVGCGCMAKPAAAGAAKKPPSVGDFVWDRLRGRYRVSKVDHSSKDWHVKLVDAV